MCNSRYFTVKLYLVLYNTCSTNLVFFNCNSSYNWLRCFLKIMLWLPVRCFDIYIYILLSSVLQNSLSAPMLLQTVKVSTPKLYKNANFSTLKIAPRLVCFVPPLYCPNNLPVISELGHHCALARPQRPWTCRPSYSL